MRYSKLTFIILALKITFVISGCKKTINSAEPSITSLTYLQAGNTDKVNKVTSTSDGGFLYCGYTGGDSTNADAFLLKVNSSGRREWYKTFGGSRYDEFKHAISCSDGGYIAVGTTNSIGRGVVDSTFIQTDYIVKTNANGIVEWEKSYVVTLSRLEYVIEIANNEYIAVGQSFNAASGNKNIILFKYGSDGSIVRQKYFQNWTKFPPLKDRDSWGEYANFASITDDGSLLIGGCMDQSNRIVEVQHLINYTLKVDLNNFNTIKFFYAYPDYPRDITYWFNIKPYRVPTVKILNISDGQLIATFYDKNGSEMAMQLIKTDFAGTLIWQKQYYGLGNSQLYDIIQNSDNTYTLLGCSSKETTNFAFIEGFRNLKIMLLKVDKDGNEIWVTYTGDDLNASIGKAITPYADGWKVAGLTSISNQGIDKMFVGYFDKNGILLIDK